jgi:hypothetical protein
MAELGAGNGSDYPSAIDTDNVLESATTDVRFNVPNDSNAAIVAIETELGTDPAGSLSDVKTYLQTEHNADGTHDSSIVAELAGAQTVTGAKTFNPGSSNIPIRDKSRGLIVKSVTAATADIDADEVMLQNATGFHAKATSVNLTVNIGASGANGLDTGAEATSTWYYIWVIMKSDGTTAGLLSTNSAIGSISFPSGYTFGALVGAVYNDSGDDFDAFYQRDNRVWIAEQKVLSDVNGLTSWTAENTNTPIAVPPIAKTVSGNMGGSDSATASRGIAISGDANGLGMQVHKNDGTAASGAFQGYDEAAGFNDIPLITAQTIYYIMEDTTASNFSLGISGYTI